MLFVDGTLATPGAVGHFDPTLDVLVADAERSATVERHPRCGPFEFPGGDEFAGSEQPVVLCGAEVGVKAIPVRFTTSNRVTL